MWPNRYETADLATFTEDIRNGKLHFMYSVKVYFVWRKYLKKIDQNPGRSCWKLLLQFASNNTKSGFDHNRPKANLEL